MADRDRRSETHHDGADVPDDSIEREVDDLIQEDVRKLQADLVRDYHCRTLAHGFRELMRDRLGREDIYKYYKPGKETSQERLRMMRNEVNDLIKGVRNSFLHTVAFFTTLSAWIASYPLIIPSIAENAEVFEIIAGALFSIGVVISRRLVKSDDAKYKDIHAFLGEDPSALLEDEFKIYRDDLDRLKAFLVDRKNKLEKELEPDSHELESILRIQASRGETDDILGDPTEEKMTAVTREYLRRRLQVLPPIINQWLNMVNGMIVMRSLQSKLYDDPMACMMAQTDISVLVDCALEGHAGGLAEQRTSSGSGAPRFLGPARAMSFAFTTPTPIPAGTPVPKNQN